MNDPNRTDDALYVLRLIGEAIIVSMETVVIVEGLQGMGANEASGG